MHCQILVKTEAQVLHIGALIIRKSQKTGNYSYHRTSKSPVDLLTEVNILCLISSSCNGDDLNLYSLVKATVNAKDT